MDYCFEVCKSFGRVVLSENKKACALIVYPDEKWATPKSVLWDLKLITNCIGISGLMEARSREGKIKKFQPAELLYYLWFIGVHPLEQNKDIGSILLSEIIQDAEAQNRELCLETSTEKNIPSYQEFGFKIYNELDLGYKLFFLKR